MKEHSRDVHQPDPREQASDPSSILVRAIHRSQADWERMLTAPRPPGRLIAIGGGLGALEGSLLGGVQGGLDGAIGGIYFGLVLGQLIAIWGWRLRSRLRNFALAMFLGLTVEAIGSLILGRLVLLNARGALPVHLDLKFLKTMLFAVTVGIGVVVALFASMLANLRRSVIAGTIGAVVGGLALSLYCAPFLFSDPNCPGLLIPVLGIVCLIDGLFAGFIIGAIFGGTFGVAAKALRWFAASSRDDELAAAFPALEDTRRASAAPLRGSVDPLLAPPGQEPLPRWVPQRVQVSLWANWIQFRSLIQHPPKVHRIDRDRSDG
jgi:MFS family permease